MIKFSAFSMPGVVVKEGIDMQIDLMDVRLDEKRLPYVVHETVGEYVGDEDIKISNPQIAVRILNEVFHMKDFAEKRVYLILLSGSGAVISFAEVSRGVITARMSGSGKSCKGHCILLKGFMSIMFRYSR